MHVAILHFHLGFVKMFFKSISDKKKKHNKIVTLARRSLNRIESETSDALTINKISHEDFVTCLNEEKKY